MKAFEKKTDLVERLELHDVALRGPTTIFNNSYSCFGDGGLAWRRFCLLFCWGTCDIQNRTPLKPRVRPNYFLLLSVHSILQYHIGLSSRQSLFYILWTMFLVMLKDTSLCDDWPHQRNRRPAHLGERGATESRHQTEKGGFRCKSYG